MPKDNSENPFLYTETKETSPHFYKRKIFLYLLLAAIVAAGIFFGLNLIGFAIAVSIVAFGLLIVDLIAFMTTNSKQANDEIELADIETADEVKLDDLEPDAELLSDEELAQYINDPDTSNDNATPSLRMFSTRPNASSDSLDDESNNIGNRYK